MIKHTTIALAALLTASTASVAAEKGTDFAPVTTPLGITIQPLGKAQGYGLDKGTAARVPRDKIAFANAEGMTLYYNDQDNGKPTCIGDCAKEWPPALAAKGARPVEGWSLIALADGTKQWALKGKPLYTYSRDAEIGSVGGNSPSRYGRGPHIGPRGSYAQAAPKEIPMPKGWHEALMFPVVGATVPGGIAIRENEDAMALVLVDEQSERTIYAFDGDPAKAAKACTSAICRDAWQPLPAPRLASPAGEFGVASRDDGIRQWSYKGRALFTFSGDLKPEDANGIGVDNRWQVASFARYYVPVGVTVQTSTKLGKVLATASGQTLYRRNAYILQTGSGHSLHRGDPIRPAVGRDIGGDPRCQSDCDRWHPFLAPADAVPSGDWSVLTRSDGRKQWTNRGYALWTFDGDKAPGDMFGNDSYEIVMSHDGRTVLDMGTPTDGVGTLFWIVANP